jgi:citrate synthase
MSNQEAMKLLRKMVTSVAHWQSAACQGRKTKAAEANAKKGAEALLRALTGAEPSAEDVEYTLAECGLV